MLVSALQNTPYSFICQCIIIHLFYILCIFMHIAVFKYQHRYFTKNILFRVMELLCINIIRYTLIHHINMS